MYISIYMCRVDPVCSRCDGAARAQILQPKQRLNEVVYIYTYIHTYIHTYIYTYAYLYM